MSTTRRPQPARRGDVRPSSVTDRAKWLPPQCGQPYQTHHQVREPHGRSADAQAVKGGSIVYQKVLGPTPPPIKPADFVYGTPQQNV